jgi:hypothetical protein
MVRKIVPSGGVDMKEKRVVGGQGVTYLGSASSRD